ncbi:hypothetical protein WJX73_007316 [Symbiochloris irregularis]|uniref:Uncharacterized protein n=1 Tax=Symbiochloris irregularis TaxID=706552 RepID=A0AAW1NZV5_9CHLO
MALSNFLLTLVGVGAIAYLMKSDVRTGSATLRRNLKHIRAWLEEQQPGASEASKRTIEESKPKVPPDKPKPQ